MKKTAIIFLSVMFLVSIPLWTAVSVMHHFAPSNVQGGEPLGDLTTDGTHLYGMARTLGQYNCGTIFRINMDGGGFTVLHAFRGGPDDGRTPYGSLALSGTTLYGMTYGGGDADLGVIFKIQTDGSGYTLLHEFIAGDDDGGTPYGSLFVSGSTLYGMTYAGGDYGRGTIFKIATDGTGFTLLHEFAGGADDGSYPIYGSALILSGSTLYGATSTGGDANLGTVFKIETDGTGFALLYEFAGGHGDGAAPIGSPVLSGSTLYGLTRDGGAANMGWVYKIETDGTGYTLMHEFTGGSGDGNSSQGGSLVLSDSVLFGMTLWGGDDDKGVVFSIKTSGGGFDLLKEFSGKDGADPYGSLLLAGTTLYGMTSGGGGDYIGTVFKIETSGTGFSSLFSFDNSSVCDGGTPRGTPIISGTTLYGLTSSGGKSNNGTIYKMETNGTGYAILHEFMPSDGEKPYGTLLLSGSTLYGMTYTGGAYRLGTIFKMETDGTGFTVLHSFAGGATDGSWPYYSPLILSGSTLYGMTYFGGSNDFGTIFKIETNGSGFALLRSFTESVSDGEYPFGGLIISGSTLSGMTLGGGASMGGTIFSIGTDGSGFTLLHSFAGGTTDGRNPRGDLLRSGATLYGMTYSGGASNRGTVFKINTDGSVYTLLHSFALTDGANPYGSLTLSGSTLYGMTYGGGAEVRGTIFKIETDGSSFAQMHSFSGGSTDGAYPYGGLAISNGTLFGMTNKGGSLNSGILFALPLSGITLTSPNGGENWTVGSSHDITWFTDGSFAQVGIAYSIDNGSNWVSIVQPTANDGSYTWTVPIAPSTTCLVRVSDAADDDPLDASNAVFTISSPVYDTITVTSPNGGESWTVGEVHDITWTSTGSVGDVKISYSTDNWNTWTDLTNGTANDGSFSWTIPNTPSTTCWVQVAEASDTNPVDWSDAAFIILVGETVSTPTTPSGPSTGVNGTSYDFSTGGSTSSEGHLVQYKFDWNDGSDSGWMAVGTTQASHAWTTNGTYNIRAMARCSTHTTIESSWSDTHEIVISDSGSAGYYNSPANRLILTEVNWAAASGGGNWISEVQVMDMTGGSTVQVYYDSGTTRHGPFTLWTNSGGGNNGAKYANILSTIDSLDSSAFVYYGTSGALEFVTQDASHLIQASVRTYNGNYTRTFPALADVEANTAAVGRDIMIPNISNNASYRPSVVLFNPSDESISCEVKIIGSNGVQVGSTIVRTLAGYEMNVISTEVRANTYSNATIWITPTSGSGRIIASGQTANNYTNDPAAHLAVQVGSGYPNSPSQTKVLTEVNWASASGGGQWVSEVQITDISGGSTVQVYYNNGVNRRGPFTLWSNGGGANAGVTFANILQTLSGLDSGFTYFGTSGALEFTTQDGSHLIQAAVRTYNGNFSRTFPALSDNESNTVALGRVMVVPNICNNATYRPSLVLFNVSGDSITAEAKIIGGDGVQIGSTINRTIAGHEMNVVSTEVRANTYDNAFIRVEVTSGSGRLIISGQSANNYTNDPAAHVAVQGE